MQVTLGSPITSTIALTYNAFGQRASYTVTPAGAGGPSLAETFQYRGDQLAQVAYSGTSVPTPYTDTYVYTQDGNPLELLRQQQGSGTATPYWYVIDGQSNVVALTDQGGNVVNSYQYDQWGRPTGVQESVPQQLRYAGYWYDNETQWYWLTVRSYDPALGRFLQPDPSEIEGLFNYVYAGDNPADRADPSGLHTATSRSRSISLPPQSGNLLTANNNVESNVQVGSAQWNHEVIDGKVIPFAALIGALEGALVPGVCGGAAVCEVSFTPIARLIGPLGSGFDLCSWLVARFACWLLQQEITLVHGVGDLLTGAYNLAVVDLASNAVILIPGAGDEAEAIKIAEADLHATDVGVHELTFEEAERVRFKLGGCSCFPASTGVLTPHGLVAINSLHIGDQVLAEDPGTHKVESERVQAVIDDGIRPLMKIGLSDGSSLSVTTNHPFYVDSGPGIAVPQWVQAGNLAVETGCAPATVGMCRWICCGTIPAKRMCTHLQ